ncbi:FAD-dependent monooxygenase [Planotetraspora sp. A-T 1434]|uniref:NAD(P)/FAD-dependent oxidoreductase n=1 Tax=Planotetraspora sp. A-T 1434 TaxID=2979219 RepID=UPI0021C1D7D4|nr:FAD-dependent monooxygenase [Planotetraspora sp. A-T 1434]MCT9935139.1 FAD-dependent monooxygenase [Planotetraspora sp. A-T 1434]
MNDTDVAVIGGGLGGLAAALALAGHGFTVRVLERAPAPAPLGKAGWPVRSSAPQTGHSHVLTSLGLCLLRRRAPDVLGSALEAGAEVLDLTVAAPSAPGVFAREKADAELAALAVRRIVLDEVLHRAAAARDGITLSYGTAVRGVRLDGRGRRPAGVVTGTGELVPAAIVLDATGRRALSRTWTGAAGGIRTGPTAVRIFTRFYRLTDSSARPGPLNRGNAAGGIWDHYAAVLHPAGRGLFAVSLGTLTGDPATTPLRGARAFTAAARLSPGIGPWLASGVSEPLTAVRAITSPPNTLRTGQEQDGQPHGIYPVGDAACITDPLYGRGMSLALTHAFQLADLLAAHPVPDAAQHARVTSLTEELFRPWYQQAERDSAARIRSWRSAAGLPEAVALPVLPAERPTLTEIAAAAHHDPMVWRGLTRVLMSMSTPEAVFDDRGFRDRVLRALKVRSAAGRPVDMPTPPTRKELLQIIAAAEEGAGV